MLLITSQKFRLLLGNSGQKLTQKQHKMTVSASTKTFENNWRTADPISVKLAQYVYHLNMFHLLKTEGVNQTKGNRGQFQINKKCQEFIKCRKAGNFLVFDNIFTANIYTGNAGEEGGGALLPMRRCSSPQ